MSRRMSPFPTWLIYADLVDFKAVTTAPNPITLPGQGFLALFWPCILFSIKHKHTPRRAGNQQDARYLH